MSDVLSTAGKWFTIGKIVLTFSVASATSLGVAFYTADYVSRAYLGGLTTAVEQLRASVDDLSETVRSVNSELRIDIRTLNESRIDFAQDVAERVAAIQAKQQVNESDIQELKAVMVRIEDRINNLPKTSAISYDEAAKSFKVEGFDAVYKALGVDPKMPVFIGPITAE
jgi:outer membrane murein-binding lipoprotein Lpp